MATTTQTPSRRPNRLAPLSTSQYALLRASKRDLKELRAMRILNLKERCMHGDYAVDPAAVGDALAREAVLDATATAITAQDKISKCALKGSSRSARFGYAMITIERSHSSKHALWHVVGWTVDMNRATLAVTLRQDLAEDLRRRMMGHKPA